MKLRIDHVTLAASRLEPLASAFARAGLATEYGGLHSNGVTHMSLLGFDDGSYVELISTHRPQQPAPWWHAHISTDGGPCAWAVRVADVGAEAERLRALGVRVDGPTLHRRSRPDGGEVQWDLAYVGDHGPGAMHPFIIKDRTPRELRVSPSPSVHDSELSGVAMVILGVPDAAEASREFRRLYGLSEPEPVASTTLGAGALMFSDAPLALASPPPESWIADRLRRYGPTPCAYLVASRDLDASAARLPLGAQERLGGRRLAWIDIEEMRGLRLGVLQERALGDR